MAVKQLGAQGQFLYQVRRFNKASFNRLTLLFAGRYIYAAVHHTGRRSGRAYTTPVIAFPTSTGFITPLPFGPASDWCRNVMAAGQYTLQWRGVNYEVNQPEVVTSAIARPLLPFWLRPVLGLIPLRQFLIVKQIEPAQKKGE